jgi:alkylated DNA nucleotide flippase Atl1
MKSQNDNTKVTVKSTSQFGRAVFAERPIRKNEVIAIFDGNVYDDDYEPWTEDMYNHAIQFGKAIWRDSNGIARLVNHSCEPNCGIKNLFSIVAMRAIEPGEQITWDYEMTEKNTHWKMKCKCGSKSCRKVIGNYSRMPAATRKKYTGFISDWLVQKPASTHRKFVSIMCAIPKGKVATYGQIAKLAGHEGQARQVVWALHSSSRKYVIPWHRVINSLGKIALDLDRGYSQQRYLLKSEGIEVSEDGKIELADFQWTPRASAIRKCY